MRSDPGDLRAEQVPNKKTEIVLPDEQATLAFGQSLAQENPQGLFFLRGSLGVGKTTLVRGYLRGLGYEGLVKSPTYTLIEPYNVAGLAIAHLDLYRIENPLELEFLGLEDTLADSDVVFVEWPERGEGLLPEPDWQIKLNLHGEGRLAMLWEPSA